jgi:hypothetical protein
MTPYRNPRHYPSVLLAKRRAKGSSIRAAAGKFGIDPRTWRDWERDRGILYRNVRVLVARILGLPVFKDDHRESANVFSTQWAKSGHRRATSPAGLWKGVGWRRRIASNRSSMAIAHATDKKDFENNALLHRLH